VGLRSGRRDPDELQVGDAVDFMRVECVEEPQILRLRYEGRMPGKFWLQFDSHLGEKGETRFYQTLFVETKGLLGLLYWYLTYPAHALVFPGLYSDVIRRAQQIESALSRSVRASSAASAAGKEGAAKPANQ
jgi:hypothetical protein